MAERSTGDYNQSDADRADSDFAAVWKDGAGRKQRKLPIYDAAHAANARARYNQTDMPASLKAGVLVKIISAEKKFKIGEYRSEE